MAFKSNFIFLSNVIIMKKLNNTKNMMLATALSAVLASCGGGGNSATAPAPTPTPTPNYLTQKGHINAIDNSRGTLTYNPAVTANRYTYTNPQGDIIDLASTGFTGQTVNFNTSTYSLNVGGTNGYTALRYGKYRSDPDASTITRAVFAVGGQTPTASVPTTGTATYNGYAFHLGSDRPDPTTMVYNVDFANRTLSATGTGTGPVTDNPTAPTSSNYVFNLTNGTIVGNSFSGNALTTTRVFADGTSNTTNGTFEGNFYGTAAQELGGVANFDEDGIYATSFGGRR
jgi:hypothetical protein